MHIPLSLMAEQQRTLGNTLLQQGDAKGALAAYDAAVSLLSRVPQPPSAATAEQLVKLHSNRAQVLLQLGRPLDAHQACSIALGQPSEAIPANILVKLHYRRGTALAQLDRHAEAVPDLKQALVLDPSNKQVAKDLEASLVKAKKPTTAKATAEPIGMTKAKTEAIEEVKAPKAPLIEVATTATAAAPPPKPSATTTTASPSTTRSTTTPSPTAAAAAAAAKVTLVTTLPQTSFEFEKAWRGVEKSDEVAFAYLTMQRPEDFARVVGDTLDGDKLSRFVQVLLKGVLVDDKAMLDKVKAIVEQMPKIARFGINLMFLAKKETEAFRSLIEKVGADVKI